MALIGIVILIVVVVAVLVLGGTSAKDVQNSAPLPGDADIKRMAREGNLIMAIKEYRRLYNVGLAEAKAAVERMAKE